MVLSSHFPKKKMQVTGLNMDLRLMIKPCLDIASVTPFVAAKSKTLLALTRRKWLRLCKSTTPFGTKGGPISDKANWHNIGEYFQPNGKLSTIASMEVEGVWKHWGHRIFHCLPTKRASLLLRVR